MKYSILVVLAWLFITSTVGQSKEIGLTLGGSNYIGDVGKVSFLTPTNLGFGVVGKINKSNRHSFRASFLYLPVVGNDSESSEIRRALRGYRFKNSIKELSIGIEYTFWDWDYYSERDQGGVPYLYTGLTTFNHGTLARNNANELKAFGDSWTFAIPMVVGYKMQLARFFRLAFEVGARYTLTDNIDGSDPNKELRNREDLKFGNLNNNDWYVYSGVILTYTFGRKPCFCTY